MHARLPELVGELVEMGGAVFPGHFVGEGVDQPGVAAGVRPGFGEDVLGEGLAGGVRVLLIECADLGLGEIAQAQRLGLDVEGGAAGDDFAAGDVDAVVLDVAQTAQDDGLREGA